MVEDNEHMKTYFFYIKEDIDKEPINLVTARSLQEALEIFCYQKQLDEEDFLEIYKVELN